MMFRKINYNLLVYFSAVSVFYHFVITFSERAVQRVYMLYILHVSKMVRHTSGASFPHQNREKCINMWLQIFILRGT